MKEFMKKNIKYINTITNILYVVLLIALGFKVGQNINNLNVEGAFGFALALFYAFIIQLQGIELKRSMEITESVCDSYGDLLDQMHKVIEENNNLTVDKDGKGNN